MDKSFQALLQSDSMDVSRFIHSLNISIDSYLSTFSLAARSKIREHLKHKELFCAPNPAPVRLTFHQRYKF
jgi:hypothetical protein